MESFFFGMKWGEKFILSDIRSRGKPLQLHKSFNKEVNSFIFSKNIDKTTKDQLRRASFSIMLNIPEGSGRFTKPDKRNFYIISRDSTFESVLIKSHDTTVYQGVSIRILSNDLNWLDLQ